MITSTTGKRKNTYLRVWGELCLQPVFECELYFPLRENKPVPAAFLKAEMKATAAPDKLNMLCIIKQTCIYKKMRLG